MDSGEQVQPRSIRPEVLPASSGRAWWRRGVVSTALDEALLSAISLSLALVLIRGASKAEYGVFALVSSLILLVRGLQSSLVLTPIATMGGRLRGADRSSFVHAMSQLQAVAGLVVALAVTLGIWLFAGSAAWLLAAGGGAALLGTWLREFRRSVALLDGRSGAALAGDTLFVGLSALIVAVLWMIPGAISAGTVLAATGASAGLAAFLGFPPGGPQQPAAGHREVIRGSLRQARWSVPGTAVVWAQTSGYAYVVGAMLDPAAVGELAASRLFVVPLLLTAVAWGRLFLPRASALLADGAESVLLARCRRTLRAAVIGAVLYLAALAVAFAFGASAVLPADYEACAVQVPAWGAFVIVSVCRTVASCALIARLEFRAIFAMTVVSATTGIALVFALVGPLGATGAIVGLTAGELVLAALAWHRLLKGRPAA